VNRDPSAPSHSGRVDVGGGRVAYRVDGPADGATPVVLLHSLGTDLRMWSPQVAPLARRFRVVRYDCRGHGASDVPREPIDIERLGRDLIALLDHLEMRRAHLCGVSLGGVTALWVATHHPERVDRLVLANTGARIGTTEGWDERIRAVRAGGMSAVRDAVLARFLGPSLRAAHPEVEHAIGEMLDRTPAAGYVAVCQALRDADLTADVARIRAPALIVAGELDESTPLALSEALHAAIPGSELTVLPGAAHLSSVEEPDAFTALVERFLTADDRSPVEHARRA
jgi:3-oxoadipate enol-lactonase